MVDRSLQFCSPLYRDLERLLLTDLERLLLGLRDLEELEEREILLRLFAGLRDREEDGLLFLPRDLERDLDLRLKEGRRGGLLLIGGGGLRPRGGDLNCKDHQCY